MRRAIPVLVLACAACLAADTKVDVPTQPAQATAPLSPQRMPGRPLAPGTKALAAIKPSGFPPSAPVVVLQGVCAQQAAKGACQTVITRADLERFAGTSGVELPEQSRGRAAVQYARTLAFSSLAEHEGLDKNPTVQKEIEQQMKLVRLRVLASAFMQSQQSQSQSLDSAELRKYYDEHKDRFERVTVSRMAVPVTVPVEGGKPLDRAAIKAELERLRPRAAAGEDLNQLQLEAYRDLHIQAVPPQIVPEPWQRTGVQGDEAKVFDLAAGDLTPVLDSPAAFAILKLESKETAPFDGVRPQIEAALVQERLRDRLAKLGGKVSAEFNLQYLNLSAQPDVFALTPSAPVATRGSMRRGMRTRP